MYNYDTYEYCLLNHETDYCWGWVKQIVLVSQLWLTRYTLKTIENWVAIEKTWEVMCLLENFVSRNDQRQKTRKKKPFFPDFSMNLNMTISLSTHLCIRINALLKTKNPYLPTETFSGEGLPISVILLSIYCPGVVAI